MKNHILLILLFFASCGQTIESKSQQSLSVWPSKQAEQEKKIEKALAFVNAYVAYVDAGVRSNAKMKELPNEAKWVQSSDLATQSFKTELKRIKDEAYQLDPELGLNADPILDAQDYPALGFELDSVDQKENYLVVRGKNWPEFKVTIKMVNLNNNWLVDGCGIVNIPPNKQSPR